MTLAALGLRDFNARAFVLGSFVVPYRYRLYGIPVLRSIIHSVPCRIFLIYQVYTRYVISNNKMLSYHILPFYIIIYNVRLDMSYVLRIIRYLIRSHHVIPVRIMYQARTSVPLGVCLPPMHLPFFSIIRRDLQWRASRPGCDDAWRA